MSSCAHPFLCWGDGKERCEDMPRNPRSGELVVQLQPGLDYSLVGAKSANLGRAIEHGFPVPPGFVITRNALNLFLTRSDLLNHARRLTHCSTGLTHPGRVENYRVFRLKLLATSFPRHLIDAITPFAECLSANAPYGLAVRSSTIYEDSACASFAGVYESFLGIRSLHELLKAIQRCWCAAWAPLALEYARKMGIAPEPDAMAVLVQPLLRADSAGVLFTADPMTGNPWRFVLESSFGLARDLMASAGEIPVDRFSFEWNTGDILSREIRTKKNALVPRVSGIEDIDISPDQQCEPSLSDQIASRIAQLGLQIDRVFGTRVDLEWVVVKESIHVVQVRPITALPAFFPHHLPAHLADRTWRPPKKWHFPFKRDDATVTLPFYRDKLITERYSRSLEVGPVETPYLRKCLAEMDFHGHRYLVQEKGVWPHMPPVKLEQYLIENEPQVRSTFLHNMNKRIHDVENTAICLENEEETLERAIDAILWVREEVWSLLGDTSGPSQFLAHHCRNLLNDFVDKHTPKVDVNDLTLGHHPALNPYFPHVLMGEAEKMAKLLEPERKRFESLSMNEFVAAMFEKDMQEAFAAALEDFCGRFCLVPPWQFEFPCEILRDPTCEILRLIRNAIKGAPSVGRVLEETTWRREAALAEIRETLASQTAELRRLERLYDWALFWGPALNQRVLRSGVPTRRLRRLFRSKQGVLLTAGLIDEIDDVLYFTVDDLKVIAVTGDIATGRRLLLKRRREYEHANRLDAPAFLGKAPEEESTTKPRVAADTNVAGKAEGKVIGATPAGPGRSTGIVRRIETLEEGDDVACSGNVVVLVKPVQSTNWHVPLLFSMLLRVRGLIVPDAPRMWMNHISQIARECRVPVVRVVPSDLGWFVDGCQVEVDGTGGIVTLTEPQARSR